MGQLIASRKEVGGWPKFKLDRHTDHAEEP